MAFLTKFLRELSDCIAATVAPIINSSFWQGIVPVQWEILRITLIPKLFPHVHADTDIRPTAVTSAVSEVAEEFIGRYFNEFLQGISIALY